MHDPTDFPTTLGEVKGGIIKRAPRDGCLWLLIIFVVGAFVVMTLIWLWDLVF